ncbi:hypothetical protein E2542_SST21761 [Spatholobus suberectus]|nr:hypothetical protein E2542_SST21761 [Spatholobus suberectus]
MELFPHRENMEALKFPTRRGTEIVSMNVQHPMAKSTILYSHVSITLKSDIPSIFEHSGCYKKYGKVDVVIVHNHCPVLLDLPSVADSKLGKCDQGGIGGSSKFPIEIYDMTVYIPLI